MFTVSKFSPSFPLLSFIREIFQRNINKMFSLEAFSLLIKCVHTKMCVYTCIQIKCLYLFVCIDSFTGPVVTVPFCLFYFLN